MARSSPKSYENLAVNWSFPSDLVQVCCHGALAGPRRDILPPDGVRGDRVARREERAHATLPSDLQGERMANAARHFGNFQLQVR